ncbi:hypothetical protein Tco_0426102 [Tanacetum coccineum]
MINTKKGGCESNHLHEAVVSYNGPLISSPPYGQMNRGEQKDTVQPSTENIRPSMVHTIDQIGEARLMLKTKQTFARILQGPTRENAREKDDLQLLKFMGFSESPLRAKFQRTSPTSHIA